MSNVLVQESYSPDDNRKPHAKNLNENVLTLCLGFDLRPFLYPSRFPWQFKKIDDVAAVLPDRSNVHVDMSLHKDKTE
jgi:NAD+ synthase (glutamine-hydrolysing)